MFTGLFVDSFVVSPYIEQSHSEIVWDIAGGPSPYYTPNVLSELSYEKIKALGYGIQLAGLYKFSASWALYFEGNLSDASIKSGKAQDSDYAADNRGEEFSRSYADIKDDNVKDVSYCLGVKTRWFGAHGHYFTFLVGHRESEINLTVTNGTQIIPAELNGTAITGLKSTYNSDFSALFYGIGTEHVFQWGTLGLRYEIHNVDFDAQADWNLRDEFAHPKSFTHTGDGKGRALILGYSYQINRNWDAYFNFSRLKYEINNGYDQTYFATGESYVTTLNSLDYESDRYQVGIRYIF